MALVKRTAMVVGLALALGLFILTPAQAGVFVNESIPFMANVPNPCTNEVVSLQGAVHLVVGGVISPSGKGHLTIQINGQGVSGDDMTGRQYQGAGAANVTINADVSDFNPFILSTVVNFRLISQGLAEDLLIKAQLHITVNANAEVTAGVLNIDAECR